MGLGRDGKAMAAEDPPGLGTEIAEGIVIAEGDATGRGTVIATGRGTVIAEGAMGFGTVIAEGAAIGLGIEIGDATGRGTVIAEGATIGL